MGGGTGKNWQKVTKMDEKRGLKPPFSFKSGADVLLWIMAPMILVLASIMGMVIMRGVRVCN